MLLKPLGLLWREAEKEVDIRKDAESGDVIRARKPAEWAGFFRSLEDGAAPADFLDQEERDQGEQDRDPFADDGV